MYQNRLIKKFNGQTANSVNNQLINNTINMTDAQLHQQLMITRMEQMKKIKNVSDLGLTKEQITDYIICPIKVERNTRGEIEKYVHEEESQLTKAFLENNWWKSRTNTPYKNILKHENFAKDFKSANDLVVHKVTNIDKLGLLEEYEKLVKILEKHNNELKNVYSLSEEATHKKDFEFVNKYKYKMKYDPKDVNDLREYYKKEQKKIDAEHRQIDNIIARLIDDDIGEEEIKQLEMELEPPKSKRADTEIDKQIMELLEEHGGDILSELDEKLSKVPTKTPEKAPVKAPVKSAIKTPNVDNVLKIKIKRETKATDTKIPETTQRIKIVRNTAY